MSITLTHQISDLSPSSHNLLPVLPYACLAVLNDTNFENGRFFGTKVTHGVSCMS